MIEKFRIVLKFLASITFALMLIGTAATMVIAGTIVESQTNSHKQAAYYTYESPFFSLLLFGFFINILLSALGRFPFKVKHLPFLITHLGLLMVIAGQLVKKHSGTQGSMSIVEGSCSQEITLMDTYTLLVESKDNRGKKKELFSIPKDFTRYSKLKKLSGDTLDENLQITLLGYAPNVSEKFESWIKANKIAIRGAPPFEIEEASEVTPFKVSAKLIDEEELWNVKGVRAKDPAKLALDYYIANVIAVIKDSKTNLPLTTLPLRDVLASKINTKQGTAKTCLTTDSQQVSGIKQASLVTKLKNNKKVDKITIDLFGKDALINKTTNEALGKAPITIDLIAAPSLIFFENTITRDTLIFGWTQNGQIFNKIILNGSIEQLIAYDDGYLGYTTELKIPLHASRTEKESLNIANLKRELKKAIADNVALSPPLEAFKKACESCHENFVEQICEYLSSWNQIKGWLYPSHKNINSKLEKIVKAIDWDEESETAQRSCMWLSHLFEHLDPVADNTQEIIQTLKKMHWPQANTIEQEFLLARDLSPKDVLQKISHQIFSIAEELPKLNMAIDPIRAFSAYMRAYNIHLAEIVKFEPETSRELIIETAVTQKHTAVPRDTTLENEVPAIFLRLERGASQETISLAYDKSVSALKWPTRDGKLQLRFQPEIQKIPHSLRLRQARQLTYADTSHPYSYECDLLVTNAEVGEQEFEKTMSMNNVHETSDGYRFYLSNIFPPEEASLKRVQIVVNKDPGKYILTYPGSFLTALGIVLLFWFQPYKKKKSNKIQ